jgi:hypothetical protein
MHCLISNRHELLSSGKLAHRYALLPDMTFLALLVPGEASVTYPNMNFKFSAAAWIPACAARSCKPEHALPDGAYSPDSGWYA